MCMITESQKQLLAEWRDLYKQTRQPAQEVVMGENLDLEPMQKYSRRCEIAKSLCDVVDELGLTPPELHDLQDDCR